MSIPLVARLAAKLDRSAGPLACWPWRGGHSRGSRREALYPELRQGGGSGRVWRVNRLVLLLAGLPAEVVRGDPDLLLRDWLPLIEGLARGFDAAHTCEASGLGSRCGNPRHLAWEGHGENVRNGMARKKMRDHQRWQAEGRPAELPEDPEVVEFEEAPHACGFCGDPCDCARDEEGECQFCSACNGEAPEPAEEGL